MTDIDELGAALRESLFVAAQQVRTPDGLAERLVADVPAGASSGQVRAGRAWVRPTLAAAAVVAVVAGVTSVATHHRGAARPATRSAVVPWNPTDQRPIVQTGTLAPTLVQPPPVVGAPKGLRACVNSDLRLVGSNSELAGGQALSVATSYRLLSIAPTSCSVSGYGLSAVLVDATGTALPDDQRMPAGAVRFPSDLLVRPGQLVAGNVFWAVVKGKAPRPVAIALLPNGANDRHPVTALTIPIGSVIPPPNPPNPSNVGPWRAGWFSGTPSVLDPGALNSLAVNVIGPTTVVSGQVVHARARLTNQTNEPVSLTPCPQVEVTLDVVPIKPSYITGSRGPLNCAPAPKTIEPGHSVTFAVQVPTAGDPAGSGRLTFSLVVDGRAVVQGTTSVEVTG